MNIGAIIIVFFLSIFILLLTIFQLFLVMFNFENLLNNNLSFKDKLLKWIFNLIPSYLITLLMIIIYFF